ncbi:ABC transporter ATP-binding protein [Mameliella alba]|uniref:ABC transporter ATP-binding protein n=1 Tax=Mameliella alba TaxID=561184 RepID=UPI000888A36D|nr:ABC transporter ATP-binding protein [Mameliella alba]MBY6120689.1 ABC transporter ATP-binding protein [Mameliella alba]OWV42991.1 ABC transporter ATP-binding protein [Mameliella alba]OWV47035.1 ABC transporter ATP-binding protein [Mameliella alba]OWV63660.1 ABC transporter ATP-binding protein [Mameliella alba]PTR37940.1 flagellar assembly protein FliH [Mameliella alba]
MSALAELLEDFGAKAKAAGPAAQPEPSEPRITEAEIEGQKLEAFEKGYRAGWDDAVKAQSDDRTRISSAFGQHLQDLSFTYHEAYTQVMNAVTPLLDEMVRSLLPEMARQTLGHHIVQQLQAMSLEIGRMDVVIAVHPDRVEAVEPLLEQDFGFPICLTPDDSLAEEQADIRFGATERQIDLSDLAASLAEAVAGFAHDNQRKMRHG